MDTAGISSVDKYSACYPAMAAAILLFLLLIRKKAPNTCTNRTMPEPGGGWPILGHIPLLLGKAPAHRILAGLADRYGPMFSLRLGCRRLLVVSSADMARECFTTNDRALGSRPCTSVGRHIGFNYASFGLAPAGPTWRRARKLAVQELLSPRRLDSLHHIWVSEVDALVRELHGLCMEYQARKTAPVDVKEKLWTLSFNVITRMVVGKRNSGCNDDGDITRRFQRAAEEVQRLLGVPTVGSVLPFLKWLDWKYEMELRKTSKEIDSIMEGWLEEHRGGRRQGEGEERDLMDELISFGKDGNTSPADSHTGDTFVKATAFMLMIASAETTSMEMTWALSALMNNPRVLKKAREELDAIVGRDGVVKRSDISRLDYLRAVVKETLRLYPVAPLLAPHEAIEDFTLAGTYVPAGTWMVANVWKIQRDPSLWPNPDEFLPERFMGRHVDIDVWGRHFELLPFGSGRRSCVGTTLALEVMQLTLARMIHEFDWSTPSGDPVDMTEGVAFSMPKTSPLHLTPTPRLSRAHTHTFTSLMND